MDARPGVPGRFWRGVAVAFFALSWLLAAGVLVAKADPYVPPEAPTEPALEPPACAAPELAPYEGSDHAAGELRLQRGELLDLCKALSARLDRLRERVWWLVAEAVQAREQRATTNGLLGEVRDRLKPPVEVRTVEPVPVEDAASQQYSDQLVSAIDAGAGATKEALWFLIGLLVMSAGLALYRFLKP